MIASLAVTLLILAKVTVVLTIGLTVALLAHRVRAAVRHLLLAAGPCPLSAVLNHRRCRLAAIGVTHPREIIAKDLS